MKIKKNIAIVAVTIFSIFFSCINVSASDGLNGESGSSSITGGGNFMDYCQGLRFTLIDEDGYILDKIDIYNDKDFYPEYTLCSDSQGEIDPVDGIPYSAADYSERCMFYSWVGESNKDTFIFSGSKLETRMYKTMPNYLKYSQYCSHYDLPKRMAMSNVPPTVIGNDGYGVDTTDYGPTGKKFKDLFIESFFGTDAVERWGAIFLQLGVPGDTDLSRVLYFYSNNYNVMIEPVYWVFYENIDGEPSKVYGTLTELLIFAHDDTVNCGLDFMSGILNDVGAQSMYLSENYENPINGNIDAFIYEEESYKLSTWGGYWLDIVEKCGVMVYGKEWFNFAPISVEPSNYQYRTNTDVVTSFKLVNNFKKSHIVPTVTEIGEAQFYGEAPASVKAEIIFSTDSEHKDIITDPSYPTALTIQGIPYKGSINEDGSVNDGFVYMYFKWKTPDTPQTLYITYRFMYPDGEPIFVIPLKDEYGPPRTVKIDEKEYYEFTSEVVISDTIDRMAETTINDKLGGFIGGLSPTASQEFKDAYNQTANFYRNYDRNAVSPIDSHLPVDENGIPYEVTNVKWTEYTAEISADGTTVKLIPHQYRADSWLEDAQNTEAWIKGPKNPVVVMNYTPQKIKNMFSKIMNGIPAGYGFSFSYQETYNGSNELGSEGYSITSDELAVVRDACTMYQRGMILFPEYNYAIEHAGIIETVMEFDKDTGTFDCAHALEINENSLHSKVDINNLATRDDLKSRVHFIPVWYPENTTYTIEVLMFDFWTPVGQVFDRETYTMYVDGTIYDNWYVTKSDVNQKR